MDGEESCCSGPEPLARGGQSSGPEQLARGGQGSGPKHLASGGQGNGPKLLARGGQSNFLRLSKTSEAGCTKHCCSQLRAVVLLSNL